MSITLAVKYRPKIFSDVCEQDSIITILSNQLKNNSVKNSYLFVGPAGCGKTTCARIFANEINKGKGNPIEMDAASNSGVDDVRNIIQQAQTKSIDSDYKVFIIDECHSISNTGWQAFLKLLEEPPATSIFIFCTTNPEHIPKTILSRVQRYDFQRISQQGIVDRLEGIIAAEGHTTDNSNPIEYDTNAVEYLAKQSQGGMRDAITMLDQCLSYSNELTLKNVLSALGLGSTVQMQELTTALISYEFKSAVDIIEELHNQGYDLKLFIKSFLNFLVNVEKKKTECPDEYVDLPLDDELEVWIANVNRENLERIISFVLHLNYNIKWEQNPKLLIEATFVEMCI